MMSKSGVWASLWLGAGLLACAGGGDDTSLRLAAGATVVMEVEEVDRPAKSQTLQTLSVTRWNDRVVVLVQHGLIIDPTGGLPPLTTYDPVTGKLETPLAGEVASATFYALVSEDAGRSFRSVPLKPATSEMAFRPMEIVFVGGVPILLLAAPLADSEFVITPTDYLARVDLETGVFAFPRDGFGRPIPPFELPRLPHRKIVGDRIRFAYEAPNDIRSARRGEFVALADLDLSAFIADIPGPPVMNGLSVRQGLDGCWPGANAMFQGSGQGNYWTVCRKALRTPDGQGGLRQEQREVCLARWSWDGRSLSGIEQLDANVLEPVFCLPEADALSSIGGWLGTEPAFFVGQGVLTLTERDGILTYIGLDGATRAPIAPLHVGPVQLATATGALTPQHAGLWAFFDTARQETTFALPPALDRPVERVPLPSPCDKTPTCSPVPDRLVRVDDTTLLGFYLEGGSKPWSKKRIIAWRFPLPVELGGEAAPDPVDPNDPIDPNDPTDPRGPAGEAAKFPPSAANEQCWNAVLCESGPVPAGYSTWAWANSRHQRCLNLLELGPSFAVTDFLALSPTDCPALLAAIPPASTCLTQEASCLDATTVGCPDGSSPFSARLSLDCASLGLESGDQCVPLNGHATCGVVLETCQAPPPAGTACVGELLVTCATQNLTDCAASGRVCHEAGVPGQPFPQCLEEVAACSEAFESHCDGDDVVVCAGAGLAKGRQRCGLRGFVCDPAAGRCALADGTSDSDYQMIPWACVGTFWVAPGERFDCARLGLACGMTEAGQLGCVEP